MFSRRPKESNAGGEETAVPALAPPPRPQAAPESPRINPFDKSGFELPNIDTHMGNLAFVSTNSRRYYAGAELTEALCYSGTRETCKRWRIPAHAAFRRGHIPAFGGFPA